jgi:hypothetical protein
MRCWQLVTVMSMIVPGVVYADQSGGDPSSSFSNPHFGFSAAAALEFGGSKLATAFFTNGGTGSLTAGNGALLEIGGNYRPAQSSPWDFSLMGGYKINEVGGGSGGHLSFNHGVFELIGSYHWTHGVFAGAGPVYHTSTNITLDGFGPDVPFKAAAGGEVQVGWRFFALTYTVIRYPDNFGYTATGDNVGIRVIGNF